MRGNNSCSIVQKERAIFAVCSLRIGIDRRGGTTLVTFMGCPLHCCYCLLDVCHEDAYEEDGRIIRKGIRMRTPWAQYDIVKKDNIYFQTIGGSICFRGGELTPQVVFIEEFARLCPINWKLTLKTCLGCWMNLWIKATLTVDGTSVVLWVDRCYMDMPNKIAYNSCRQLAVNMQGTSLQYLIKKYCSERWQMRGNQ